MEIFQISAVKTRFKEEVSKKHFYNIALSRRSREMENYLRWKNKTGAQKVQMNSCRERKEKIKAVVAMLENKTTNLVDDITLLEIKVSALIGNAAKSKQESSDALDKLLREASAMNNNEFKESEDELRRHMSYADQLFKLAPTAPKEVADSKCVGTALKSGPDGTLPLECAFPILLSEKLSTDLFPNNYCSSEKIYLSDPLEIVDLYKGQRQRLLILHQHIDARVQKLKDIKRDVKEMKEKVSPLEENLSIQESVIKPMLEMEDRRAEKFRIAVQRKETQMTETQDPIFTPEDRLVTEIYSCFFKEQPISTPLTTREKIISVIMPIDALLKTLENIPEKHLQKERGALMKARMREHKRQQEMEREKEKQRKCKRALTVREKMPGRKLVERSRPLPKVEVKKEPSDVPTTLEGWLFHHILSK